MELVTAKNFEVRIIQYISILILMMTQLSADNHIVLLHGLARTKQSMNKMEVALESKGYVVHNLSYQSRQQPIEVLAKDVRRQITEKSAGAKHIHFVTHSLGGIIVRQIQVTNPIENIGRVVMLSPPNQGSEVVDTISHWWLFKKINGPAGQQLGTAEQSLVQQLPPINFECGVLTGDRSINWINSCMIPGKDDGKVSTESARTEEVADFRVHHVTHTFIMKRKAVIADVICFLKNGKFEH